MCHDTTGLQETSKMDIKILRVMVSMAGSLYNELYTPTAGIQSFSDEPRLNWLNHLFSFSIHSERDPLELTGAFFTQQMPFATAN